jgi:hypothetical protein
MKENDPYYLGNPDCPPTRITFQTGDSTIIQELPWDATAEDVLTAVHAAMIGMTFHNDTVIHAMYDYAESRIALENLDNQ